MDNLSKDELIKLLAKTQDKPKKERKKPILDDEKKNAMLERLATMRETVKQNREKKKSSVSDSFHKTKDAEIDQIFEKKYGSKFDKMTDLLIDLNENSKEQLKLKKEKAAKKAAPIKLEIKEKEEPEEEDDWDKPIKKTELVRPTTEEPSVAKPSANSNEKVSAPIPIQKPAPPPNAHPQSSPNPHSQQYLLPNRMAFKKSNTRF